jgi:hypothetical protein
MINPESTGTHVSLPKNIINKLLKCFIYPQQYTYIGLGLKELIFWFQIFAFAFYHLQKYFAFLIACGLQLTKHYYFNIGVP